MLDAHPAAWALPGRSTSELPQLTELLDALLVFINAFSLLGADNKVIFVLCHPTLWCACSPPLPLALVCASGAGHGGRMGGTLRVHHVVTHCPPARVAAL